MDTLRIKREKVQKFQEDQSNDFDERLPSKLREFNSNMSRVDINRYQNSEEKTNKLI
jgi:hypothetical protein